jgi:hypothetical protein
MGPSERVDFRQEMTLLPPIGPLTYQHRAGVVLNARTPACRAERGRCGRWVVLMHVLIRLTPPRPGREYLRRASWGYMGLFVCGLALFIAIAERDDGRVSGTESVVGLVCLVGFMAGGALLMNNRYAHFENKASSRLSKDAHN